MTTIPPAILDAWKRTSCCLVCGRRCETLADLIQHLTICR